MKTVTKDGGSTSLYLLYDVIKLLSLIRKPQDGGDACPEGGAVSWQRVTLILELLQHKKKLKRAQMLVPVLFSLLGR